MDELLEKMYDKLEKIDDKLGSLCERTAMVEVKYKWLKLNVVMFWGIVFSSTGFILSRFLDSKF